MSDLNRPIKCMQVLKKVTDNDIESLKQEVNKIFIECINKLAKNLNFYYDFDHKRQLA